MKDKLTKEEIKRLKEKRDKFIKENRTVKK